MDKSAILHIPMSQYAYGVDETHVTIRLRAKKNDLVSCILFYGDRACRQTPVIFTKAVMKKIHTTALHDFYEVTLDNPYKRLCYYFELKAEDEEIFYYGDCFCKGLVDDRSEYFQLPFNHRADIVNPPAWAKDAVIYNIFPDSYATDREFISGQGSVSSFEGIEVKGKLGGTIKGIKENIPYLKELGVNAIYINPIFVAGEYHKYDLVDYYHIDPCFGSNEEFKEMVSAFHENGIRVIIDGVFNHCGWKFFAFEDVVEKGEASKYKDWFYGLKFPVVRPDDPEEYPTYECFGYERMMPKLNLGNPEAAEYFVNVGKYWVSEYDIDGWRLDVASEINDGFWRAFYKTVKSVKSDAILIGEVWETANHWLDGTIFDSAMNYDFRKHCRRFFAEESIDAEEFGSRVVDMLMRYRKQTVYSQLNVLDTHDVSRFLSLCGGDANKYKLAVLFQMTFPGMPSIFYGDEKGITGILEADYRHPMIWDGKRDELFEFYRAVIDLRKKEEALRSGDYRTVSANKDSRVYVYERCLKGDTVRICLNMSDKSTTLEDNITAGAVLMEKGFNGRALESKGFVIFKTGE